VLCASFYWYDAELRQAVSEEPGDLVILYLGAYLIQWRQFIWGFIRTLMPLYEYHCQRCGLNFEVLQKFSDDPLTVHDECGGPVERLISPPALQFKGSGWYVTDYARRNAGTGANGKESKPEAAKTESKTESKSESKAENKPAPAKTSD
jgi:putative FmdB family regulatory protein